MPNFNPFHQQDSKPSDPKEVLLHNLLRDIHSQLKPDRIEANHELLKSLSDAAASGGLIDDKQYVPEKFIQILASLPEGSKTRDIGSGVLLKRLWDNLQHPPLSYTGNPFRYRAADGSNNNVLFPHVGRSGSFYARSVIPKCIPTSLPDPGTLFDALLARRADPRPHPSSISSLLFALATIIIHDLFRTSDQDQNIVAVSSYLDLSPLYGTDQETQDSVRTFKDGKLKPDAFAEIRMLGQPPECAALLVAFSRFHNYIVGQLLLINEGGRFLLPVGTTETDTSVFEDAVAKQDNALFQTGRLVTCGLYLHIIMNDYIRTIINLHRTNSTWNLDPQGDYEEIFGHDGIEKGIGNQVSVEFNLIYRWHSAVSVRNERWLNDFFVKIFPNKLPENLTQTEFRAGIRAWAMELPVDPGQRTFGGLKRNESGRFEDSDLVQLLTEAAEDPAAAFGARHVPIALKAVEILGIQQSRGWGVATLNEVRVHFGMIPHKTFLDINSDPSVAASLEALYGDVDNVELYPGVVAEEPKVPLIPGSGLCAGFTITRAILSDAIALVRGDRFYTLDYSPATLTAFGFTEVSNDRSIAGGGVLYKLMMRSFPGWYRRNSIYAFHPFTIPSEMRTILRTLDREAEYDYNKPVFVAKPTIVTTWKTANEVLLDSKHYNIPWGNPLGKLSTYEVMLGSDAPSSTEQRKYVGRAIFSHQSTLEDVRLCFEDITSHLIRTKSHSLLSTREIEVVHDVASLSWAQFVAQLLHLHLRNDKHPNADFDDEQLFDRLQIIFHFVFLDSDTAESLALQRSAIKAFQELREVVRAMCGAAKGHNLSHVSHVFQRITASKPTKLMPNHGDKFVLKLLESGKSIDEVTTWIITLAFGTATPGSQALSQALDLFLSEPYKQHWPVLESLAAEDSPDAFEKLRRYALEALRLTTPAAGILRIASADDSLVDGSTTHQISKGSLIIADVGQASRDPSKLPAPEEILLDRPEDTYIHFGHGTHTFLGRHIVPVALAAQLKVFARLKNLRRAPGQQGRLISKKEDGVVKFLCAGNDRWSPFPHTLKLHYDSSEAQVENAD